MKYTQPLSVDYRGHKVISAGAPASGAAFLLALNVLGKHASPAGPKTVEDQHRMAEALKWCYAHRTMLGDPRYVQDLGGVVRSDGSVSVGKQKTWTSPEFGKTIYDKLVSDEDGNAGKAREPEWYDVSGFAFFSMFLHVLLITFPTDSP